LFAFLFFAIVRSALAITERIVKRKLRDEAAELAIKDRAEVRKLRYQLKNQQASIDKLRLHAMRSSGGGVPQPLSSHSQTDDKQKAGEWVTVSQAELDMGVGCSNKWSHGGIGDGKFRYFAAPGADFKRPVDALEVLSLLHGKKVLWVGDSVGRQMFEVFKCAVVEAGLNRGSNRCISSNNWELCGTERAQYANSKVTQSNCRGMEAKDLVSFEQTKFACNGLKTTMDLLWTYTLNINGLACTTCGGAMRQLHTRDLLAMIGKGQYDIVLAPIAGRWVCHLH
jgi:hypothetical protein